ncbi:hypothetical protein [Flavobacterium sp.]|uniref:hypothetical protein n=1 Tax=Flavobacterium sp. TaxID=239 RepID=UPI003D2A8D32
MKKSIFLVAFLISTTFSAIAQDMATLKVEAKKAYISSANMNYDAIFETTYPKVFDIVPKEQMKLMFEQMMSNEQFTIKLVQVEPNFKFGEIKKIGKQSFCLIDHDNVMEMSFKEPMEDPEMMTGIFKSSMEAEEVTYDKEKKAFRIKMRSTLIAVADELTSNKWKFLNKDKENKLFTMIFNETVKSELGL